MWHWTAHPRIGHKGDDTGRPGFDFKVVRLGENCVHEATLI